MFLLELCVSQRGSYVCSLISYVAECPVPQWKPGHGMCTSLHRLSQSLDITLLPPRPCVAEAVTAVRDPR